MLKNWLSVYFRPEILVVLCLGFASGLPLALTASTLSIWLRESGLDIATIGIFAAVATPYNLKFLWAPLIDGARFPLLCRLLGQRRGWLLATQLATAFSIMALGMAGIFFNPWLTAVAALLVAFCSASQDIVVDAYRVEILKPEQYGPGAAVATLGYRVGLIASTAGALHLASRLDWPATYAIMGALMAVGMLTTLLAREPSVAGAGKEERKKEGLRRWLRHYVADPLLDFTRREHWRAILLFILLYKLGDAFLGLMPSVLYVELGFTKEQIGNIVKFYGMLATIAGSFIGAAMTVRLGVMRSLWICGIAQALTNLMFIGLVRAGADTSWLALTVTLENITGGMATAAFVAFLSGLCNLHFTATQYALLSSLSAVGRTWFGASAGGAVKALGWEGFFLLSAALAIPGLVVLRRLQKKIPAPS